MRVLSAVVVGLMLAVFVVGVSLFPMLHPTFTRVLSQRYSLVAQSGLPQQRVLAIAEQVRDYVLDVDAPPLPQTVDGRPGFDATAVSHLNDVRRVIDVEQSVTGVLAAVLAVWIGLAIARRRLSAIGEAFFAGAACCVLLVVLGGLAGTMNFDNFFAWFHGLFFAAGTWQFPANALLIEVFPEDFWMACGVVWAGLILFGGLVLGVFGMAIRGAQARALVTD
jgi:integral membrane protein (TIGR01906 family)